MADNVTLPGTGASVATDDVAGVQFQRVKLDIGGDGASSPITASNPMPVALPAAQIAALTPPAAITGFATEASLGVKVTSITALETGGSGIIGWLSQLWRDTMAMSAKLPASLGAKTAANSLSVAPAITGTPTSKAGTITAGGTAQTLAAANTTRIGLTVQNNSTGDLRVSVTATAAIAVGFKVPAGALLVLDQPYCGTGAVSIWGATTAQEFHALESTP